MLNDIVNEREAIEVVPSGTLHQPLDILIDQRDKAAEELQLMSGSVESNSGSVT